MIHGSSGGHRGIPTWRRRPGATAVMDRAAHGLGYWLLGVPEPLLFGALTAVAQALGKSVRLRAAEKSGREAGPEVGQKPGQRGRD
jgi:hypothetical protein